MEGGERWKLLLSEDRAQRFDVATPPLLRFTLVRFGPREQRLVFTHHHLLLDGWSTPLLISELLANRDLPPVVPYRKYLVWLAAQDREAALAAWQEALAGLEGPTRLALTAPAGTPPETIELQLPEAVTSTLTATSRAHGLTLNTVIQGAWAILLGQLTSSRDVVFGSTVSGRPPEIAGIESMVGLFINTLPVRVRMRPEDTARDILERLQEQQSQLLPHQHVALAEIQRVAGLGELFDTLVVFESYPVDSSALKDAAHGLRVRNVEGYDVTHYPLCLAAVPAARLRLNFQFRADWFERAFVEALGGRMARLLEAIAANPDRRGGAGALLHPPKREQSFRGWGDTSPPGRPNTLPAPLACHMA